MKRVLKFIKMLFHKHDFCSRSIERKIISETPVLYSFEIEESCRCGEKMSFSYTSSLPNFPERGSYG